jgi:hypothetical protein
MAFPSAWTVWRCRANMRLSHVGDVCEGGINACPADHKERETIATGRIDSTLRVFAVDAEPPVEALLASAGRRNERAP